MGLGNIKSMLRSAYYVPGWHTKRKLVVIESDDWGSIRMASKKSFEHLLKLGYPLDKCAYSKNDALESDKDLEGLFEILGSVKDKNNRPAKITINNVVCNPDFEKIKANDFKEYYFETFIETLKRYPQHGNVMKLYQEGIQQGVAQPQFHGREHVHVLNWMKSLQTSKKFSLDAFNENMFSVYKGLPSSCHSEFLDAMATYNDEELNYLKISTREGVKIFKDIWGFYPSTIIPSCYTWHAFAEEIFKENNFQTIQTGWVQVSPKFNQTGTDIKRRYTGEFNKIGMSYTTRNVIFEPSIDPSLDWVNTCLKEISKSFFYGKPAIISSHRLNFMGSINVQNREQNLQLLKKLLVEMLKKWPNIEFISSDELANLIHKNH